MNTTQLTENAENPPEIPPPQAHHREQGSGVLLNEDFECISLPPEIAGLAGWEVVEIEHAGKWYRPASPIYVSWLVAESRRRLSDLARPDHEILSAKLRTNFDLAVRQEPILAFWANNRVFVPVDYRGPGKSCGGLRRAAAGCGGVDLVSGPPYPARYYSMEDMGDHAIQFLGRNNPAIQKRFSSLFPVDKPKIRGRIK